MFNKGKNKSPEPKIDFIQSFGKLEFQDGDIIVLKHPRALSDKSLAHLQKFVEEHIVPRGKAKVVVLEDGMDIGILRHKVSGDTQDKSLERQ